MGYLPRGCQKCSVNDFIEEYRDLLDEEDIKTLLEEDKENHKNMNIISSNNIALNSNDIRLNKEDIDNIILALKIKLIKNVETENNLEKDNDIISKRNEEITNNILKLKSIIKEMKDDEYKIIHFD